MVLLILGITLLCVAPARSETTIEGNTLAYRSAGVSCPDNAWRLNQNGFAGAYIHVAEAGEVSLTIRASKNPSNTSTPVLGLRVADFATGWPVRETGTNYGTFTQRWRLPAGTYCVRVENANDRPSGGPWGINVRDLHVTGATVLNSASDANALAAADTYIEHFRKGPATLTLLGDTQPLRNSPVRIRLKRHAFNFGTAVSGVSLNDPGSSWLRGTSTNDINYRNFVIGNFNAVVPENAGKWPYNERRRGVVTLDYLDSLMKFAALNGLQLRMHGLLWDVDKPDWVKALQDTALNGTTAGERDRAKLDLRGAISQRIQYFVRERSPRCFELDVINEPVHSPIYYRIFGLDGVAGIYNEAKAAVVAAGAATRLVPNEFAVFQSSEGTDDPYANWYREHVESLRNAGGAVDGIGIQYYAVDGGPPKIRDPHSPSRIAQVLHNLATLNLPLSITEFGVQKYNNPTPQRAADMLADTLRVSFGHEKMTTFVNWGFWPARMWPVAPAGALVDANWKLTPAGKVWQQLTGVRDWAIPNLPAWTTEVSATTDAQGRVTLTGFYGDYEIVSGQQRGDFTLAKGLTNYMVKLRRIPVPPAQ
jgi:GH35 family endo-1,4-beta-xylanase